MTDYGLDVAQFRSLIVRPTLAHLNLWSQSAENLVLGTALHESHLKYIDQLDKLNRPGPAFGLFQMEGPTHADLYHSFLKYQPELKAKVIRLASYFSGDMPDPGELVFNLRYACAMCRVHYRRVKAPLPPAHDVSGLAGYWKTYFNTHLGKGTVTQAMPHFQRAVDG